MTTIFLFDVDGTLVRQAGGPHLQAMADGVKEVLGYSLDVGVSGEAHTFGGHHVDGMTNAEIFRVALAAEGMSEQEIIDNLPLLNKASGVSFAAMIERGVSVARVIDGVPEALDALRQAGFTMGLLTGGIRSIATAKLEAIDLIQYFSFGGFGDRAFERSALFPEALAEISRAGSLAESSELNVVYVGDTVRDVEAAHKAGAIAVGVATGPYTVEQLTAAGADYAFPSLAKSVDKLLELGG